MKDSATTQTSNISTIALDTDSHVLRDATTHIFNLYSATSKIHEHASDTQDKSVPFIHPIVLKNTDSTAITTQALFDEGAMTGAMSTAMFNSIRHELKEWRPSSRALRMANGAVVRSEATWTGTINIENVEATGTFEVFNSQGGWSLLFGKPLLRAFKAVHDYTTDKVTISDNNVATTLHNHYYDNRTWSTPQMSAYQLKTQSQTTTIVDSPGSSSIFTRQTDPFAAPQVEYITRNVQLSTNLTSGERNEVINLLTEFADMFACALSEVLPIPGAYVDLNIPEDTTFRTMVHQRPMNAPQREFMS